MSVLTKENVFPVKPFNIVSLRGEPVLLKIDELFVRCLVGEGFSSRETTLVGVSHVEVTTRTFGKSDTFVRHDLWLCFAHYLKTYGAMLAVTDVLDCFNSIVWHDLLQEICRRRSPTKDDVERIVRMTGLSL